MTDEVLSYRLQHVNLHPSRIKHEAKILQPASPLSNTFRRKCAS